MLSGTGNRVPVETGVTDMINIIGRFASLAVVVLSLLCVAIPLVILSTAANCYSGLICNTSRVCQAGLAIISYGR